MVLHAYKKSFFISIKAYVKVFLNCVPKVSCPLIFSNLHVGVPVLHRPLLFAAFKIKYSIMHGLAPARF